MKLTNIFDKEFLSSYKEKHAFVIGVYSGLTELKGLDSDTMKNPDVISEIHYAYGGYIMGTILRYVMIISMVYFGVNVI